ncbi:MAG: ABC transporter substrate-binding protein [Thermodesulfobacteriota bacterium]
MKRGLVAFILAVAAIAGIVVLTVWTGTKRPTDQKIAEPPNLHTSYTKYQFDHSGRTVHFGIQPLWMPAGNIAEVMSRDAILTQELGKLGLSIRFHAFLKGDDITFFVKKGDLQGGMVGDVPALLAAAVLDILIPAATHQGFDHIVASRELLIRDLKGKRIGYPYGSVSHRTLLEALASDGVTEDQVSLIPQEVTDLPDALAGGFIDAFAAWEPATMAALSKAPTASAIHRSRHLGLVYFTREFATNHSEAMHRILAAEIRAVRWLTADRNNLARSCKWVAERSLGRGTENLVMSPDKCSAAIAELGQMQFVLVIPERDLRAGGYLEREFEFLKSLGNISSTVVWTDVRKKLDRSIMTEILASPLKYRVDEFRYELGDD